MFPGTGFSFLARAPLPFIHPLLKFFRLRGSSLSLRSVKFCLTVIHALIQYIRTLALDHPKSYTRQFEWYMCPKACQINLEVKYSITQYLNCRNIAFTQRALSHEDCIDMQAWLVKHKPARSIPFVGNFFRITRAHSQRERLTQHMFWDCGAVGELHQFCEGTWPPNIPKV